MDNRTHELNMSKLAESLRAAGIGAQRCGRSEIVCSFPGGNYMLRLSLTGCNLEHAKQYERERLNYFVKKSEDWEKAALARANSAELRAMYHRENAIQYRKMLEELD